jgi:hypothetical protein
MKTYLKCFFSSEGSSPSEIKDLLLNMGFEATRGNYDFVYDWGKHSANIDELIWFADKIQTALKGCKVMFSIETI